MNNIRKSETFRFFKTTSVYVFIVLMAISPFFELFMMKVMYPMITRMLEEMGETEAMLPQYTTSFVESFFGITDTMFFQLASIVIVSLFVSSLYRLGPIKQLASIGIKRSSIIMGQFLAIYSCFVLAAVVFGIENGAIGMLMGPFGEIDAIKLAACILGLLLAVLANIIVPFMVTHITGSVALGIVFPLVIIDTIESTISIVANLAHIGFVNNYLFTAARSRAVSVALPVEDQLISMLVLLVYITPMIILSVLLFNKKDIK